MAEKYEYIRITAENMPEYESILPDIEKEDGSLNIDKNEYGIGITSDGVPCGAVVLQKNKDVLTVRSIRFVNTSGAQDTRPEIWGTLIGFCIKTGGFKRLECRYTDDEPGITEEDLRNAGFTDFIEESGVYRVNANMLGSLLRDGPEAGFMRRECARLMSERRAHSLEKMAPVSDQYVRNLYPIPDLSFLTVDDEGVPESYVMISSLPDGSLYLADIRCASGKEADLAGLFYMSLGSVFMEIEPEGEFYMAAVTPAFDKLFEFFLSPVIDGISYQRILLASRSIG
ncbi:MAG: hypothetical protein K6F54_05710 [Lachnospiraceae bacterium]|nr:hypothetical protein [Lachnospiraceae bacterium]